MNELKVPAKDGTNDELGLKFQELKTQKSGFLAKRNGLTNDRNKFIDQIKAIQANIKRKQDEDKNGKERIGFKSAEDIDKQIRCL